MRRSSNIVGVSPATAAPAAAGRASTARAAAPSRPRRVITASPRTRRAGDHGRGRPGAATRAAPPRRRRSARARGRRARAAAAARRAAPRRRRARPRAAPRDRRRRGPGPARVARRGARPRRASPPPPAARRRAPARSRRPPDPRVSTRRPARAARRAPCRARPGLPRAAARPRDRRSPPAPARPAHRRRATGGGLPPHGGVQVLDLLHRTRVDPGGEVLPAVVADDEHDVALLELPRDPHGDRGDGARRPPGEDALLVEQPARPDDRVVVGDEDLAVEQREIDDRRDEAVVERPQALHGLALHRLGGDDLHRVAELLAQPAGGSPEGAARAEAGPERGGLGGGPGGPWGRAGVWGARGGPRARVG